MPRQPGAHARLEREAMNLRAAYNFRPGGFDSIPRVVAYGDYCGHRLLLETAISGQPMEPPIVQRQTQTCLGAGLSWVMDFHHTTRVRAGAKWFAKLVEHPLQQLEEILANSPQDLDLIAQVRHLASPLQSLPVPLVFSHGDLIHPNLFLASTKMNVVDWELAEPQSLPAVDLFLFLNYIAAAQHDLRDEAQYFAAFQEAFFSSAAWCSTYITLYADKLQLPAAALTPLFVVGWARYLLSWAECLREHHHENGRLTFSALQILRNCRHYRRLQYVVEHWCELKVN